MRTKGGECFRKHRKSTMVTLASGYTLKGSVGFPECAIFYSFLVINFLCPKAGASFPKQEIQSSILVRISERKVEVEKSS